ncbi:hypothetical protein K1U80_005113 [Escherichia coli]|nr:hypothetical protein [Escherichia coli]
MKQQPSLACAVSADLTPESELDRPARIAAALKAIRSVLMAMPEEDLLALFNDVQKAMESRNRAAEQNKLVDQGLSAHSHQQANVPDFNDYF